MQQRVYLIIAALLLVITPAMASALELAKAGVTRYHIATTAQSAPAIDTAVQALAVTLDDVTGAEFAVQNASPAIRLQDADKKLAGGPQAFRIARDGEDIVITGNSPQALLYGSYRLLEDYAGVHWFTPGEASFKQQPTLDVQIQDRTYAPRFAYREVFYRHSDAREFAAHNRLNGRFGHRRQQRLGDDLGGDTTVRQVDIFKLVPPEKYGKSHPEYYGGGQLRFANPQVRQIAAQRLQTMINSWQNKPDYILIAHADRETYHRGGADAALIEKHNAPGAAYLQFVREIAGQIKQPGTRILAQAYLWSRKPAENMPVLPDNMGVMLSGIERDFSKPMDAPVNQGFLQDLDGWAQLTQHIVVWDYITNFAGYIQPYPNLQTLAANMRLLAERDAVEGVFAQGAYNSLGAEFAELRTWMLAKLLWDPEREPKALIETFVNGYYGPAAPYIADYIQALEAAADRWSGKLEDKAQPDAGYLYAKFLQRADKLLAQAEMAVQGQPGYLAHVQDLRLSVDYAVLSNRGRLQDAQWINAEERLSRLERYMQQAEVTAYREGGGADPESLLQALAVDRSGSSTPDACADVPKADCVVVEDQSLRLVGGGAKLTPDSAAADGGAATMPGDNTVWGMQLPLVDLLPAQGDWQIKVRARVETTGSGGGTGLQLGLHPGANHSYKTSQMAGPKYQTITLPGTYKQGDADYLWLAPAGNKAVKRILIDRIIAVPAAS